MSYNYIYREENIEHMAARAISDGIWFAEAYARGGPVPHGLVRRALPATLSRFERGDVFDCRDDDCLASLGPALANAANSLRQGYGSRSMRVCTADDWLADPDLEVIRDLIENWKRFSGLRQQVRVRLAAQKLMSEG
jgi:hypothetical protein